MHSLFQLLADLSLRWCCEGVGGGVGGGGHIDDCDDGWSW